MELFFRAFGSAFSAVPTPFFAMKVSFFRVVSRSTRLSLDHSDIGESAQSGCTYVGEKIAVSSNFTDDADSVKSVKFLRVFQRFAVSMFSCSY